MKPNLRPLKISIITITYNSERTVRDTFESIRREAYDNLEYLVIDGGSRDATLDIAKEYGDIITVLVSEPDEGISDAMNKGIRMATGELIGIIHSDDALEKGALLRVAELWDGKTDVYYWDCVVLHEDGTPSHILQPDKDLLQKKHGFCINHPATFVTKAAYEKYGAFDKSLKCCMDYDLFYRYFYKYKARFQYVPASLARYRMGGTNQQLRNTTIDESCRIMIRYCGSKPRAYFIKYKKKVLDLVRPLAHKAGIHNKRVVAYKKTRGGGNI